MRVLMLTTDLRLGGAERTIINRAHCLREMGVECAVAGLSEGADGPGKAHERLAAAGFPVFCAGVDRLWQVHRLTRLRRFILDWRPDVIHAHLFHAHLASAVLLATGVRAPLVWSHHSVAMPPRLRTLFYRFAARLAHAHVFISEAVRRHRHRLVGEAPGERVIYNGVELAPFLAVRPERGRVLGTVGRLVPEKGFDVLLGAFGSLARQEPDVMLRIAGEGPERARLERIVAEQGLSERVSLDGFVDDVPGFLAGVSVFVVPSRNEAFGNTLVEAVAAGLPCIASRAFGLSEIGGRFVRWVAAEDSEGLCTAMREVLCSPPDATFLAEQRRYVRDRFGRERMARDYLNVYLSVLPRARVGSAPCLGYNAVPAAARRSAPPPARTSNLPGDQR